MLARNSPWLWTAEGIRHRHRALPERARHRTWVAEADGEVVGWAEAEFDWVAERSDIGTVWALVAPEHRGRGLGSALVDAAVAHVAAAGATELRTWSLTDGDGFVERLGFRRSRVERLSAVDPRTVDTSALAELPDDVAVAPLAGLQDRLRDVHELYAEASGDMPADHPETNLPYEEWLRETIESPDLSLEGSMVVLVGDRPASLSWVAVDRERRFAQQELTGTARAFRRRGLARLAKLAVVRWCAAAGFTRLATGNDATNEAMLALNTSLGFRPFAVETQWVKDLP